MGRRDRPAGPAGALRGRTGGRFRGPCDRSNRRNRPPHLPSMRGACHPVGECRTFWPAGSLNFRRPRGKPAPGAGPTDGRDDSRRRSDEGGRSVEMRDRDGDGKQHARARRGPRAEEAPRYPSAVSGQARGETMRRSELVLLRVTGPGRRWWDGQRKKHPDRRRPLSAADEPGWSPRWPGWSLAGPPLSKVYRRKYAVPDQCCYIRASYYQTTR